MKQVEAGHADNQPVTDLPENDRVRAIGYIGSDFYTTVDWSGSQNQYIFFGFIDALFIHAEQVGVFANRREVMSALAFELNPQQVQAVGAIDHVVQAVGDLDAELLNIVGDQCSGAADDDVGPQFLQSPDIRPRDPAVEDITDEGDGQSFDFPEMLADGEDVQQSLGGMLVCSIAGVENVGIQVLCQKLRGTWSFVSDDYVGDSHGLDGFGGVDKAFPFGKAAA